MEVIALRKYYTGGDLTTANRLHVWLKNTMLFGASLKK